MGPVRRPRGARGSPRAVRGGSIVTDARHTPAAVSVMLIVPDAEAAVAWYKDARATRATLRSAAPPRSVRGVGALSGERTGEQPSRGGSPHEQQRGRGDEPGAHLTRPRGVADALPDAAVERRELP